MKFDEDNKIFYGQDFRYAYGVPSGIDFDVQKSYGNILILTADGYGTLEKPGCYGNGSLCVWLKTKDDLKKPVTSKADNTKVIKKLEQAIQLLKEDNEI